jgi:hypothetical protein
VKRCGSTTANKTPCSKPKLWLSKYCWLHQDPSAWIYGVVIGAIISFGITYWGINYSFSKQQTASIHDRKIKKPEIKIQVIEQKGNKLKLEVQSTKSDSSPTDNLFFKFDIPGVYLNHKETYKEKIESCTISRSFLAGTGGHTIAETIHGQCQGILPEGSFSVIISLVPTKPLPLSDSEKILSPQFPTHYNPLMDLHDYSRIVFSWRHNGEPQLETTYLDLTQLEYIQEDNKEMVSHLQWHTNLESVNNMELKRKNW